LSSNQQIPILKKPKFYYGWYMVVISWLMLFLISASATSLFFKPILDEFGWDRATLSLVGAICMLVSAAISPFLGRLIDRFGPRLMLFSTLLIQTVSNTAYGLASNIGVISVGRLLTEFKPTTATQVLINRWFVKMRGRALGIISTGTPFGTLALSPLSQYLINAWGWRTTLFFWAVMTIVLLLPLVLLVRNKPEDKGFAADGEPITIDLNRSKLPNTGQSYGGSSLVEAFGNRSFWLLAGTQLFCGIGCGLWMTHIVIFATDMGYSAMIGASFLSVQGGVSLVGVLVTGHLSDVMARNKVLAVTHFIRGISFFIIIIALLYTHGSLWMLYLAMVLFGFGWFTTAPLTGGLVADLFGNLRMGTIIGLTMAAHLVGSAIGTYGGGLVYNLTGSYFDIFVVQGILELVAMFLAFAIKQKTR
jgi:predicted MFS family arabinose efflux permease